MAYKNKNNDTPSSEVSTPTVPLNGGDQEGKKNRMEKVIDRLQDASTWLLQEDGKRDSSTYRKSLPYHQTSIYLEEMLNLFLRVPEGQFGLLELVLRDEDISVDFKHLRDWKWFLTFAIRSGLSSNQILLDYLSQVVLPDLQKQFGASKVPGGAAPRFGDYFEQVELAEELSIILPRKRLGTSRRPVYLTDFGWELTQEQDVEEPLESGAYVIVGGPTTGKTVWLKSAHAALHSNIKKINKRACVASKSSNDSIALQSELRNLGEMHAIMEAGYPHASLDIADVSSVLNNMLWNGEAVHFVDSMRFLAAISRYPARAGGVPGGLDIYATQFSIAAERLGKVLFFVMSTNSESATDTSTYATLMRGSVSGLFIPRHIDFSQVVDDGREKRAVRGAGELSLRQGTREFRNFTFQAVDGIPVTRKDMERATKFTNRKTTIKEVTSDEMMPADNSLEIGLQEAFLGLGKSE